MTLSKKLEFDEGLLESKSAIKSEIKGEGENIVKTLEIVGHPLPSSSKAHRTLTSASR